MTSEVNIQEVISFLHVWRSNRHIKSEFKLTQTQFYHLSRWLIKAGVAEKRTASEIGLDCNDRITFYKVMHDK